MNDIIENSETQTIAKTYPKRLRMSLITNEEREKVDQVLADIESFIRKPIPVVHYKRGTNGSEGKWDYREIKKETGKEEKSFYMDDYSWLFANCQHTGYDLLLLMKLFSEETNYYDLWLLVTTTKNDKEYVSTCKTLLQMLMGLSKEVEGLIGDRPSLFNDSIQYLNNTFRSNHGKLNYLVDQDVPTQNFMHHLRSIRNKWEHYDNEFPLFFPPKEREANLKYWDDARRRVVVFALMIFDRFYDELYQKLVGPNDEEFLKADDELTMSKLKSKGKEVIGLYIKGVHEKMQQRLSKSFLGTGLEEMPNLHQRLPNLLLTKANNLYDNDPLKSEEELRITDEAQILLADDTEHTRKLVVGETGSGKSVMFYRMILHDQPHLMPFYIPLDEDEHFFSEPNDTLLRLERHLIGNHLLTLNTWELQAVKYRLRKYLTEGSVVFFIDALDAAIEQLPFIKKFINTYPKCQYIIGIQSDSMLTMSQLEQLEVQRYNVRPLNIAQQRQLAATTSLHISGIDHTEELMQDIAKATKDSDMVQNPLSLMMLISLFEDRNTKTKIVRNTTSLYYELEKKILRARNLDNDQREILLGRPFLKSFRENCRLVVNLCQTIYDNFLQNPQNAYSWEGPILDNSLVKYDLNKEKDCFSHWRALFEYIEVVTDRKEDWQFDYTDEEKNLEPRQRCTELVNTLIIVTLLKRGIKKKTTSENTLPAPNPMLVKLAQATASLEFRLPKTEITPKDQREDENIEKNSFIVYRLQPRSIIQQYLFTLMEHYRRFDNRHPITFREHSSQLIDLFAAIAAFGSEMLIDRLFNPFWMRLWLIQQNDQLPIQSDDKKEILKGLAFDGSPLPAILIQKCTNRVYFILQLLKNLVTWIGLWNLDNTKQESRRIIRDIIIFKMNDREREALYLQLNTDKTRKEIGSDECIYYSNMAIASMESLSLANRYEIKTEIQGPLILEHLKSKKTDPKAIDLLLTILEQIRTKMNKRFGIKQEELGEKIVNICQHLILCGIVNLTENGFSQRFWNFIKQLIDDRRHMKTLDDIGESPDLALKILDICPLEDINPIIAEEIYDMPVFTYLQSIKKKERKLINKWIEAQGEAFNRNLYRPVTIFNNDRNPRRSIQYAFYAQLTPSRFLVATECINEMPEGKFCRINKAPDQWFYVENVQILKNEHPIKDIAELTINLPAGATRKQQGDLTLSIPNTDGKGEKQLTFNYFHLFSMGDHPLVVIRTEDQNAIKQLKNKSVLNYLKLHRNILWYGQSAMLSGIDIRHLNEYMRLIEIRPITNQRPVRFRNISDTNIPHEGTLTFYNNSRNDKDNRPLTLATTGPDTQGAKESLSAKKRIDTIVFLGVDENTGHKYIAIDDRSMLNEGNVLIWDEVSWAFCKVVKIYDSSVNYKSSELPNDIWINYECLTKQIRSKIWIANKKRDNKSKQIMPTFVQIAELENINKQKTPFVNKPGVIEKGADISFYLPITDPVCTAWTRQENKIIVNGVFAQIIIIDDKYTLAVPADADYPDDIRYYAATNYPHRQVVKWYIPQSPVTGRYKYLKLDIRLKKLWDKNQSVYFYNSLDQQEPIKIQLSSLSVNIDLKNSKRYHAAIVPFLEKEWIKKQGGLLTDEQKAFCQKKDYKLPNT